MNSLSRNRTLRELYQSRDTPSIRSPDNKIKCYSSAATTLAIRASPDNDQSVVPISAKLEPLRERIICIELNLFTRRRISRHLITIRAIKFRLLCFFSHFLTTGSEVLINFMSFQEACLMAGPTTRRQTVKKHSLTL